MSRRFFFGLLAGAFAASVVPEVVKDAGSTVFTVVTPTPREILDQLIGDILDRGPWLFYDTIKLASREAIDAPPRHRRWGQ